MARVSKKVSAAQREAENAQHRIWKTAIYARLSDFDDVLRDTESLEVQISYIKEYINHRDDLMLLDVFADKRCTGMNFDRPEFERLLKALQERKIDCIVVKDFSRLGRNFVETGQYIHSVFIAIDCVKVYEKGVYFPRITSTEKISVGAERQRRYRAVKKLRAAPTEEHLWEVVLIYQKVRFKTYSGLPSPKIMSGEISAKEAAEERIWAEQTPQRCSGPRTLRTMCSMKIDFQI